MILTKSEAQGLTIGNDRDLVEEFGTTRLGGRRGGIHSEKKFESGKFGVKKTKS